MTGHLGRRVSALLDGQLSGEEADAAWSHVHSCPPCRAEVEREGWVKTRLSTLAGQPGCERAPDRLKGALRDLTPLRPQPSSLQPGQFGPTVFGRPPSYPHLVSAAGGAGHPAHPQHDVDNRSLGRRIGLAAMGGGAVGAAVVGVLALGAAPANAPIDRRLPPASVSPVNAPAQVPVRLQH